MFIEEKIWKNWRGPLGPCTSNTEHLFMRKQYFSEIVYYIIYEAITSNIALWLKLNCMRVIKFLIKSQINFTPLTSQDITNKENWRLHFK